MRLAGVLGTLGLIFLPSLAAADPIILSAGRGVTAVAGSSFSSPPTVNANNGSDALLVNSTTTGSGVATAQAALYSMVDPLHLSGTGSLASFVSTTSEAYASASSYYDIVLQLDRAYDFSFSGQFFASGTSPYDANRPNTKTTWNAQLQAATGYTYFYYTGDDAENLTYNARMPAGNWLFYVSGQADASSRVPATIAASTAYNFRLDLTPANGPLPAPTPEPASMLLLGTGLAGVLATRRRR